MQVPFTFNISTQNISKSNYAISGEKPLQSNFSWKLSSKGKKFVIHNSAVESASEWEGVGGFCAELETDS